MPIHTENSKRINHHGIVYTVLKRKCHSVKYLVNRKYALCIHLNISSLPYHHQELYKPLSSMKTKPKIIGISESMLQINKQPVNNISLPNDVHEHTPTESGNGPTHLYIDQILKYK